MTTTFTSAPLTSATDAAFIGDYRSNPWTLVYGGAITSNTPGQVHLHPVTYTVDGIQVAANVYLPVGYAPDRNYAAVVVAHPNGGVKEQVAGLYAQHLAERGFVTIAADAAYQGASEGQPRQTDKPANRIADIQGMGDFLSTFPGVDPSRLGLLGICGGGGYALAAAQVDKRFAAVATISMFNSGRVRRNGFADSQVGTVGERLRQAAEARQHEAIGGQVRYLGDTAPTPEQIAALPAGSLYREGFEYYGQTHAHPRASSRYTMSSLMDLMAFDATDRMDLIDQPLLMVAGSRADTKYMTDDAFEKATGTTEKALFVIDGATHIQTYWVPRYVEQAVAQLDDFFGKSLSSR